MSLFEFTVSERNVQRQILRYLATVDVFAWRANSGSMTLEGSNGNRRHVRFASVQGLADIIGMLPNGRFLAIECKRRGGKVSVKQQAFIDCVNAHGGLAFVADNLDTVIEALRKATE